jgi:type IV secretory pathway VirB4 component
LKVLHDVFNMDTNEPFRFSFDMVARTGLSSKDFIAPTSFDFREGKCFKMGKTIGAVSFLQILAPELNDRMLADFLDMDSNITVNFHIRTIDQAKAIKSIKSKITDLDKMKIEEQKKAVRSGYDMEIIPSDLATFGGEAKRLLQDLQTRNERMFLVTIILMNTASSRQKLENAVFQTASIAQKYNCALKRLDFQQEEGLMSSLPIGINQVEIERGLTTSSTAIFVPFTTQELFQHGEALYYGLNALSNNMIMVDRKQLKNPNGLILGTPGSGKSFSAKREMTNAFLITDDDIIVCDPEAEYYPLVQKLGGQVIRISPISPDYINPLDINVNYSEEENPLTLKSDFILSMCELIVGGKDGLQPVEKTIIDRSVRMVYQDYLSNPVPEKMPILEDLYNILCNQKEPEAQRIATALEIYVHGSLNVFNHRTNVDVNNRFVCYDIKELGKQLKKLGMLVVQDQVWNRVTINRSQHKATRYYMDEFHLLLKEEQTAAYSVEIWKRFRKWGGIPTGITQNVKDLLASREIENIFENSDFVYLLNQASGDRQILSNALNISPSQQNYITNSNAGEGLIFYGSTIVPFKDNFPTDTMLYRIMTTKPEEML